MSLDVAFAPAADLARNNGVRFPDESAEYRLAHTSSPAGSSATKSNSTN